MEPEKTTDHKSKFNALESALNAVVDQGCKTRLGIRAAPSLTDLKKHDRIHGRQEDRNRPVINDYRNQGKNRKRNRVPEHVKNPTKFTKFRDFHIFFRN